MNQPWAVSPFWLCWGCARHGILGIDRARRRGGIPLPRLRLFKDRHELVRDAFLDHIRIDFAEPSPDGILAPASDACVDRPTARLPPVSFSSHVLLQLLLAVQRSHIGLKTPT